MDLPCFPSSQKGECPGPISCLSGGIWDVRVLESCFGDREPESYRKQAAAEGRRHCCIRRSPTAPSEVQNSDTVVAPLVFTPFLALLPPRCNTSLCGEGWLVPLASTSPFLLAWGQFWVRLGLAARSLGANSYFFLFQSHSWGPSSKPL